MPFGGFSPLPLRLGADPERGWSAPAQSRFAADLVASKRTTELATLTYNTTTSAIVSYTSQYGNGPGNAPTVTIIAPGVVGVAWAKSYKDHREVFHPWNVRAAEIGVAGSSPIMVTYSLQSGAYDVRIYSVDVLAGTPATNIEFTLTVWGEWLPDRQIGDYDGATDKSDSLTEGDSSYCYDWFLELQSMRGSAYSTTSGNVDAENFAMARQFGALSRNAEKLEANSLPGTSDEKLENWVQVLGVSTRQRDQRYEIRQRAEAKLKAATSNAQPADIDDAVAALLGNSYVAAHRVRGVTLDAATPATYWPTINPGDASYSLGGGMWASDRSFYWVQVTQPSSANDSDFFRLMGVDLFELLDLRLPAHMTFGWTTSDGFILDVDLLDFGAFGI